MIPFLFACGTLYLKHIQYIKPLPTTTHHNKGYI
jgi:hypothetical protein